MGGKSSSPATSVQSSEPAAFLKPYLKSALRRGEKLQTRRELYRPSLNQYGEKAGWRELYNEGLGYSPTQGAIDYSLGRLAMSPEEQMQEIQAASQPFVDQLIPQVNSQAALAGREGSPMAYRAFGEGVGNIAAQQRANLMTEQARLASMQPQFEQSRFVPGQQLINAGQFYRNIERGRKEEEFDRLARTTAIMFGNAPATMAGGTTFGTQNPAQQGFNPFGAVLGLGSMAAGLGWQPFG